MIYLLYMWIEGLVLARAIGGYTTDTPCVAAYAAHTAAGASLCARPSVCAHTRGLEKSCLYIRKLYLIQNAYLFKTL